MVESVGALKWAFEVNCKSASQKMVLVVMARRGNQTGKCFMAYRTIAEEACCTERTVARTIPILIRRGLIERIPGARGRATNTYRLCVDGPPVSQTVVQAAKSCRPKY